MFRNSSYHLTHISEDCEEWDNISSNMKAFFQCGERYGLFWIKYNCTCCDHMYHYDFFFHLNKKDAMFKMINPRKKHNGNIQLKLPNNCIGLGEMTNICISDAYILENATNLNYHDVQNHSLYLFFEQMRFNIQKRAAMRRLYTYMHRTKTIRERFVVHKVLSQNHVHEIGLHMRIMRCANLW